MKKKKGMSLLGYLFILIGVALVVCIVLATIMILSPGKEIAGLVYANISSPETVYAKLNTETNEIMSETFYSQNIGLPHKELKWDEISTLNINAGGHDVQVRHLQSVSSGVDFGDLGNNYLERPAFSFKIQSKYTGIYKKEKYPNGVNFNLKYNTTDKSLTLNFETPDGLNFVCSGTIIVELPYEFHSASKNLTSAATSNPYTKLNIRTNGGNVNLGGIRETGKDHLSVALYNVEVETKKGTIIANEKFYFDGDNISLKSEKGTITVENEISIPEMTVNISSGRGKVEFKKDINIKELNLYSQKADIKMQNITLPNEIAAINWTGDQGRFFANKVNGALIGAKDASATNFDIQELTGQFYLPKGDKCDVNLGKVGGKVKINSTNNDINIKNCPSDIDISMKKGSLKLENCTKLINVTSTKADITLTKCSGEIRVKTEKGEIKGSITDLTGINNYLISENDKINIQFNQSLQLAINAKSSKKDVIINFASITETKKNFENLLVNGSDGTKQIKLEAKNEIRISNIGE